MERISKRRAKAIKEIIFAQNEMNASIKKLKSEHNKYIDTVCSENKVDRENIEKIMR